MMKYKNLLIPLLTTLLLSFAIVVLKLEIQDLKNRLQVIEGKVK